MIMWSAYETGSDGSVDLISHHCTLHDSRYYCLALMCEKCRNVYGYIW